MKFLIFKITAITTKLLCTLFGSQPVSNSANHFSSPGALIGNQQKKPTKDVVITSENSEGKYVDEKGKVLSKQDMIEVLKSGQYIILKQKDKNNKLYYLVKKR